MVIKKGKKKKPKFNVPNLGFFKSVKARWRKPRGTHNKKRMKFKWAGALPKVGYRTPESVRGMHSSGLPEVLVSNPRDLGALKGQNILVRIASSVGAKKRGLILDVAKSINLVVVNKRVDGKDLGAKWTPYKGPKASVQNGSKPSISGHPENQSQETTATKPKAVKTTKK